MTTGKPVTRTTEELAADGPTRGTARRKILDAASRQFYAEGIRAVSADRIIEEVGITKVTFYRHFRSKDDLVVAYLDEQSEHEQRRADVLVSTTGGSPDDPLAPLVEALVSDICTPGFRGCPFINAAAEYADPQHPVRLSVTRHRDWFEGFLKDQLGNLRVPEPGRVAQQLVLLRDGAMVGGYLGNAADLTVAIRATVSTVLGNARRQAD
jgi:AcrR family transcriptional regulator